MQVGRSPRFSAAAIVIVALVVAACGGGAPTVGGDPSASARRTGGSGAASTDVAASGQPVGSVESPAPPSSTATGATGPTSKPVATVKGLGFHDSKSFRLKAGSYLVRWTLTSTDAAGCSVIGALHSPDGQISVEVANATLAGKGSRSGQQAAPKLRAGTYLVTFATTCAWTAQIYQQ